MEKELEAMQEIFDVLVNLDVNQQTRIIKWIIDKLQLNNDVIICSTLNTKPPGGYG